MKNPKAFTLIELLIVIVIIGILAVALIPRIIGMQDKTRYLRVDKDIQEFKNAVFIAQINTGKPLLQITGTPCTVCGCHLGGGIRRNIDLRTIASSDVCRSQRIDALRKIELASGLGSGGLKMDTDPWGSPYFLDENDGESWLNCSLRDYIGSVGPDGSLDGIDIFSPLDYTGDNKVMAVPPFRCPGGY